MCATRLALHPIQNSRMKNITIDIHFVREFSKKGLLVVSHVDTLGQFTYLYKNWFLDKDLPCCVPKFFVAGHQHMQTDTHHPSVGGLCSDIFLYILSHAQGIAEKHSQSKT